MPIPNTKAEGAIPDQTDLLPRAQLLIVFSTLALAFVIAYADQNGIGVALPTLSKAFNAQNTIAWAVTSSMIANTVFQVLYGRFSDIFGRKIVYLSAVVLLAIADILCATAQNATALYIFRGLAGIATGGINSLTMMIVSDIVTLQQRGYYQGILGGCIGLGNIVGPFLSATFAQKSTWRGYFYLLGPLAALCGIASFFLLPSTMTKGKGMEKAKLIDVWGLLSSSIAIIFFLIPISGGESYFPWNSAMDISMLTIAGIATIVFVFIEWKVAVLPMIPLSLFQTPAVATLLVQNLVFGFCYYSTLNYLPLYYQNVRQYSPLLSAALLIPLVLAQSIFSIFSGLYISHTSRYGEIVWLGYGCCTLGASILCIFNLTTSPAVIIITLLIFGTGVGNVFQPTLIALQAHSSKPHRAVVISARNFLRALGGAVGLACSSLVLQRSLRQNLPTKFIYLAQSIYTLPDFEGMDVADVKAVLNAYQTGLKMVFVVLAPLMGACLLSCVFVADRGLRRVDEAVDEGEEVPRARERRPSLDPDTETLNAEEPDLSDDVHMRRKEIVV